MYVTEYWVIMINILPEEPLASSCTTIFAAGEWWPVNQSPALKFPLSGFWSLRQTVTCCQHRWLHNNKITSLPWCPKYVKNLRRIFTMHLLITLSLTLQWDGPELGWFMPPQMLTCHCNENIHYNTYNKASNHILSCYLSGWTHYD